MNQTSPIVGRGKPGWGRDSTRPEWWPKELPWANVRMDARTEEEKQKISWTHALRKIVINCYKYHGREDLLPAFSEEDEKANAIATANANVSLVRLSVDSIRLSLGSGGIRSKRSNWTLLRSSPEASNVVNFRLFNFLPPSKSAPQKLETLRLAFWRLIIQTQSQRHPMHNNRPQRPSPLSAPTIFRTIISSQPHIPSLRCPQLQRFRSSRPINRYQIITSSRFASSRCNSAMWMFVLTARLYC